MVRLPDDTGSTRVVLGGRRVRDGRSPRGRRGALWLDEVHEACRGMDGELGAEPYPELAEAFPGVRLGRDLTRAGGWRSARIRAHPAIALGWQSRDRARPGGRAGGSARRTCVAAASSRCDAPLKASSRGGGNDASPDPLDWTAQVDDIGDQPLLILKHRGTNLGAISQFSDFECHVTPPYGERSKGPGRMTGTLVVAEYDPAPFPGVPRLFSAKYK